MPAKHHRSGRGRWCRHPAQQMSPYDVRDRHGLAPAARSRGSGASRACLAVVARVPLAARLEEHIVVLRGGEGGFSTVSFPLDNCVWDNTTVGAAARCKAAFAPSSARRRSVAGWVVLVHVVVGLEVQLRAPCRRHRRTGPGLITPPSARPCTTTGCSSDRRTGPAGLAHLSPPTSSSGRRDLETVRAAVVHDVAAAPEEHAGRASCVLLTSPRSDRLDWRGSITSHGNADDPYG